MIYLNGLWVWHIDCMRVYTVGLTDAQGADWAPVSILSLCFLFSKWMVQKNRKLSFLYTDGSGSGGCQVNTLLSLTAMSPVLSNQLNILLLE